MNLVKDRLERAFNECDKHLLRINQAYSKITNFIPLDTDRYKNLTEEKIQIIDQYLFRFSKLQDAIGEKIFSLILQVVEESIKKLTFIDILNKLERLEIIESADNWRYLRQIRNDIAHQYDDVPEDMATALNNIFEQKQILEKIYIRIKDYYKKVK